MKVNKGAMFGMAGVAIGALMATSVIYKNMRNEHNALNDRNIKTKTELYTEIAQKEDSIKSLKGELLGLKKSIATDVFNKQMDSLNHVNPKKLNRQFYERMIVSGSLIDSINGNFNKIESIFDRIPVDTVVDIWANSKMYTTKVAHDLYRYTKHLPH